MDVLKKVQIVLMTASVTEKAIDSALASGFQDFEDAVQYYSAVEAQCHYLITRNKKDFPNTYLPVMLPDEFLILHQTGALH